MKLPPALPPLSSVAWTAWHAASRQSCSRPLGWGGEPLDQLLWQAHGADQGLGSGSWRGGSNSNTQQTTDSGRAGDDASEPEWTGDWGHGWIGRIGWRGWAPPGKKGGPRDEWPEQLLRSDRALTLRSTLFNSALLGSALLCSARSPQICSALLLTADHLVSTRCGLAPGQIGSSQLTAPR